MCRTEHVRVRRVRPVDRLLDRQVALEQPLAHLRAAAELLDERAVEPRLVDPQVLVDEQAVAVEALDVVPFVRRAVAPDLDVVLRHRAYEHRPGDGASERRRVEVALARRLDVERAALQRLEADTRKRVLAVDEYCVLGAVELRLCRDRVDVRLVRLAEIRGERVRDRAVLAHPRDRAACVEPARECDPDPLPDGQRAEDHLAPRSRAHIQLRSSASSSTGVIPSTHATKTVLSPAIVPATSGSPAASIASASAIAKPRGVCTTSSEPDAVVLPR